MIDSHRPKEINIIGVAELERTFQLDKCDVDLFAKSSNENSCMQEPDVDEREMIIEKMIDLREKVTIVQEKLDNLRKLFKVEKTDNDLDRGYRVTFNSENSTDQDELSVKIYDSFIDQYSLDLTNLQKEFTEVSNFVEARKMRGTPMYCEVDLFDKDKEPVEC